MGRETQRSCKVGEPFANGVAIKNVSKVRRALKKQSNVRARFLSFYLLLRFCYFELLP